MAVIRPKRFRSLRQNLALTLRVGVIWAALVLFSAWQHLSPESYVLLSLLIPLISCVPALKQFFNPEPAGPLQEHCFGLRSIFLRCSMILPASVFSLVLPFFDQRHHSVTLSLLGSRAYFTQALYLEAWVIGICFALSVFFEFCRIPDWQRYRRMSREQG